MNRFGLLFTCPIILAVSAAMRTYLPANNASVAMHLFLAFVWSLVIWIKYRARPISSSVVRGFSSGRSIAYILQCLAVMITLAFTIDSLIATANTALVNTPQYIYIETLTPIEWITVLTCTVSYIVSAIQSLTGIDNTASTDSVTANVWLEVILAATCAQAALIALVVFMYYQPQ